MYTDRYNTTVAELEKYRDGLMSTVEDRESEIQEYTRRLGEADNELKVISNKMIKNED